MVVNLSTATYITRGQLTGLVESLGLDPDKVVSIHMEALTVCIQSIPESRDLDSLDMRTIYVTSHHEEHFLHESP